LKVGEIWSGAAQCGERIELFTDSAAIIGHAVRAPAADRVLQHQMSCPIAALVEAFTLDRCVWGSDWPFLRAAERLDYGPLLAVLDRLFPDQDDQHRLLWRTPRNGSVSRSMRPIDQHKREDRGGSTS
jgi:Amidohydrolase